MKLKILLFALIISISICFIYKYNVDKKIYYVDIQDTTMQEINYNIMITDKLKKNNKLEKYINNFSNKDYRITDLIKDIEINKKNKNQTIQNSLIKADLITIKMGDSELAYKINNSDIEDLFNYCDDLLLDIENLFKILRKYSKEDIYFIGLYNYHSDFYNEIYDYLNLKIEDICADYDIKYVKNDLNKQNIGQKIMNLSF